MGYPVRTAEGGQVTTVPMEATHTERADHLLSEAFDLWKATAINEPYEVTRAMDLIGSVELWALGLRPYAYDELRRFRCLVTTWTYSRGASLRARTRALRAICACACLILCTYREEFHATQHRRQQ